MFIGNLVIAPWRKKRTLESGEQLLLIVLEIWMVRISLDDRLY